MKPLPPPNKEAPARTRRASLAALVSGAAGYPVFLKQLGKYIAPEESRQAKHLFERGRHGLLLALWGYLVLHPLVTYLLHRYLPEPTALGWYYDFERGALFLSAFALANRFGVPMAGRILLPLASLSFFPDGTPDFRRMFSPDWGLAQLAGSLFAAGWFLDAGAWTGSPEARRPAKRWWLLPAGGIFLATVFLKRAASDVLPIQAAGFSCAATLTVWVWSARMLVTPETKMPPPDVELLREAGWRRWRYAAGGRLLAIMLGIIPFWSLLNHWDIETAMKSYAPKLSEGFITVMSDKSTNRMADYHMFSTMDNPAGLIISTNESEGTHYVWAWGEKGRLLTGEDLTNYYICPVASVAPGMKSVAIKFQHELMLDPKNQKSLKGLRTLLGTNRLTNSAGFADLATHRAQSQPTNPYVAVYCLPTEPEPAGLREKEPMPATLGGLAVLKAVTFEDADKVILKWQVFPYAFLILGVGGFVFLWRRGGDSQLARWIGIWLIGACAATRLITEQYYVLGTHIWMLRESLSRTGETLVWAFHSLFEGLDMLASLAAVAAMSGAVQGVVWGLVCAMPTPGKAGRTGAYLWRCRLNLAVCAIANAAIVVTPLFWFGWRGGNHSDDLLVYPALGQVLSTIVAVVLGWRLRRRTAANSEVPVLGAWPVAGFAGANLMLASLFYYLSLPNNDLTAAALGTMLCGVAGATAFTLAMFHLLVRSDFLHVRGIRSLVTLLLVAGLPFVLRVGEDGLQPVLARTPFFSEHSSELLLVLAAIFFIPPIHYRLEHWARRAADRRLHEIEQRVDETLDAVIESRNPEERRNHIAELFARLRVDDYAFYSYRGKGEFALDAANPKRERPKVLELSVGLREFLGRKHVFLDLETSAFEWPSFFHMFDLHALWEKTGCRYLLPVSVGEKLVALLFLPGGESPAESDDPGLNASFKNLGVGAISRTRD